MTDQKISIRLATPENRHKPKTFSVEGQPGLFHLAPWTAGLPEGADARLQVEAKVDALLAAYRAGEKQAALAKRFGISVMTLGRLLHALGERRRRGGYQKSREKESKPRHHAGRKKAFEMAQD